MANNHIGELRRSAAVMTFGPGSVVDFRADGAPVSVVAAGIEEWDRSFPPEGLRNPQTISEPRLQKKLGVGGFRLPPVVDENWRDKEGRPDSRTLVAVRFPEWLQCPGCDRIARAGRWSHEPGRAYRYCPGCTRGAPAQRKVFVVPVRFVMACTGGHLDEFPWHMWVGHRASCRKKEQADLILGSEGPGLAGVIVSCRECRARRSMDGIFTARVWRDFRCRGRRPWLATPNENCDREPRALQRGASNLYFPAVDSALSIPPWSDPLQEALGMYWDPIVNVNSKEDRRNFLRVLAEAPLRPALQQIGISLEELEVQIENRLERYNDDAILDIRQEEYRQLVSGFDSREHDGSEFEIRNVPLSEFLRPFFSRVVRVVRLREVRALKGFTRINPPGDENSPEIADISADRRGWLPAIEVRGEGVFLAFNPETLSAWEEEDRVAYRAHRVNEAWRLEWRQRYGGEVPPWQITARYILAHTLAHALMRQLTLECGYSSAALRERLYLSDGECGMMGFLIYTATSDSDGTLGGLQRQGETGRIERAVRAAIQMAEWCSSDPLCIEGMIAGSDGLSLAACHACVLAPETACEQFNRFLDRAMLVGLPDGGSDVGFFHHVHGGE